MLDNRFAESRQQRVGSRPTSTLLMSFWSCVDALERICMHHDQSNKHASLQHKRELLILQLHDLEIQAAHFGRAFLPFTLIQKLRQLHDQLDRVEAELAALDAQ